MKEDPNQKLIFEPCSWCAQPGAFHSGGFTDESGRDHTGSFCDENCFKMWRAWKAAFVADRLKRVSA